jgi:pilus assembly protein CpaB
VGILFAFVGLIAAYVIRDALRPKAPPVTMVNDVMVAMYDMPADSVLASEDIGRVNLPRTKVPAGTLMERRALVGRRLKQPIKALQPFTGNLLYPAGQGPTLSSRVKPGMRAVVIDAEPPSAGGGGLIKPGDVVDVLLTVDPRAVGSVGTSNNGGARDFLQRDPDRIGGSRTIVEGAQVLAIDASIDSTSPSNVRQSRLSVTLAVTPDDANRLALAKEIGRLQLTLRSKEEEPASAFPRRITIHELLGIEPPADPSEEDESDLFFAEVYRGTQRDELEFEHPPGVQRRIPGATSVTSPPALRRRGSTVGTSNNGGGSGASNSGNRSNSGGRSNSGNRSNSGGNSNRSSNTNSGGARSGDAPQPAN